jgi:hypothetical protein
MKVCTESQFCPSGLTVQKSDDPLLNDCTETPRYLSNCTRASKAVSQPTNR